MIAPLRRRHRWLTGSLALIVPVLYVLALSARPGAPSNESLPAALVGLPVEDAGGAGDLAFADLPVTARVTGGGEDFRIELSPAEPLAKPEILAYWTASGSASGTALPAEAWLLGAFGGERPEAFAVPSAVLGREGHLVLYSLGHQEVLGSVSLPAIGSPAPAASGETPAVPASEAGEEGGGA